MSDIAAAGFIFTVQQRIRNAAGGFRSVPAIKRVSPALFAAFGLEVALKLERTKARKRLDRRITGAPRPQVPTESALRQGSFAFAVRNLTGELVQLAHHVLGKRGQRDRDPEGQRRWNAIAVALRQRHPDWSADEIRAAADRGMLSPV